MKEASLYGCQYRVRCCCLRREAPVCSNHGIDNRPTVDATPSGILMVTRPESSMIFKLLTHHQSTTACAPHRMPPSLTGSWVCHFAPFPQGLRLEVATCKCQAHNSHGTKNNENDMLHGVISFLKSNRCHWNSLPFVRGSIWLSELHRLILPCLFHGSSTPVCTANN